MPGLMGSSKYLILLILWIQFPSLQAQYQDLLSFGPNPVIVSDSLVNQGTKMTIRLKSIQSQLVKIRFITNDQIRFKDCELSINPGETSASVLIYPGNPVSTSSGHKTCNIGVTVEIFNGYTYQTQSLTVTREYNFKTLNCQSSGDPHIIPVRGQPFSNYASGWNTYVKTEYTTIQGFHGVCHMGSALCLMGLVVQHGTQIAFLSNNDAIFNHRNKNFITFSSSGTPSVWTTFTFTLNDGTVITGTNTTYQDTFFLHANINLPSYYETPSAPNLCFPSDEAYTNVMWNGAVCSGNACCDKFQCQTKDFTIVPYCPSTPPPAPPCLTGTLKGSIVSPTPETTSASTWSTSTKASTSSQISSTTTSASTRSSSTATKTEKDTILGSLVSPTTGRTTTGASTTNAQQIRSSLPSLSYSSVPTITTITNITPTPTYCEDWEEEFPLPTNFDKKPSEETCSQHCGQIFLNAECHSMQADFFTSSCITDGKNSPSIDQFLNVAHSYMVAFQRFCSSSVQRLIDSPFDEDTIKAEKTAERLGLSYKPTGSINIKRANITCLNGGRLNNDGCGCACPELFTGFNCEINSKKTLFQAVHLDPEPALINSKSDAALLISPKIMLTSLLIFILIKCY